jgi:hypothetical protein
MDQMMAEWNESAAAEKAASDKAREVEIEWVDDDGNPIEMKYDDDDDPFGDLFGEPVKPPPPPEFGAWHPLLSGEAPAVETVSEVEDELVLTTAAASGDDW